MVNVRRMETSRRNRLRRGTRQGKSSRHEDGFDWSQRLHLDAGVDRERQLSRDPVARMYTCGVRRSVARGYEGMRGDYRTVRVLSAMGFPANPRTVGE